VKNPALALFLVAYLTALGRFWRRRVIRYAMADGFAATGWDFGLGAAIWSYAAFALNACHVPLSDVGLYALMAAGLLGPFAVRRARRDPLRDTGPVGKPTGWMGPGLAALILIASIVTVALQSAASPMVMWDSIVLYGFKAKILFHEHTFHTAAFQDASRLHWSADYPLLVPYVESTYYRLLGMTDDRWVRMIFLAFWVGWLGLIKGIFDDHSTADLGWWAAAFVGSLPLFSDNFMGQGASGFADIPLAFYWTGFLALLARNMDDSANGGVAPAASGIVFTAIFGLGCAFTKTEGAPLVFVALVAMFAGRTHPQRLLLLKVTALIVLLLLPWNAVRAQLPHNATHYWQWPAAALHGFGPKIVLLLRSIVGEVIFLATWGIFWLGALLVLFVPSRFWPYPGAAKRLGVIAALQVLLYLYVYLIYPQSLALLIPITLTRLLIHLMGPIILAAAWRCDENMA